MTTGEIIRERRKELRMTQDELADKLYISKAVISQYENGKRNPSQTTIPLLAEALNIPVELLTYPGEDKLTELRLKEDILLSDDMISILGYAPSYVCATETVMAKYRCEKMWNRSYSLEKLFENFVLPYAAEHPEQTQKLFLPYGEIENWKERKKFMEKENVVNEDNKSMIESEIPRNQDLSVTRTDENKEIILSNTLRQRIEGKNVNTNVLVVGDSATGKTTCYTEPNIKQMYGSYVITDPGGDLYKRCAQQLEENGYNVRVINMNTRSIPVNIFENIKSEDDVVEFVDYIVSLEKINDDFFADGEKLLLTLGILRTMKKEKPSNRDLCEFIAKFTISALEEESNYSSLESNCCLVLKGLSENTLKEIVNITSITVTRCFLPEGSKQKINAKELKERNTAVFIKYSDQMFNPFVPYVVKLFYRELLNEETKGGTNNNIYTHFVLNDFQNIGKIANFHKILSRCIGKNIGTSLICTDFLCLKDIYRTEYPRILEEFGTTVIMRISGDVEEYFCGKAGFSSISTKKSIFKRKDKRSVLYVDEIRNLKKDKCIVLRNDSSVVIDDKYRENKIFISSTCNDNQCAHCAEPSKISTCTQTVEKNYRKNITKEGSSIRTYTCRKLQNGECNGQCPEEEA